MRDLALALGFLNPLYQYRLSSSNPPHDIVEWRCPEKQPTEAELEAAYQAAKLQILLKQLDEEMHAYLDERGYTRDEQIGLQSVYIDLQDRETLTETEQTIKTRIRQAWTFIDQSVLTYYYIKKVELGAASDVDAVTWDFHALDHADPVVRLQELKRR
jgi:hypothetical protein